ncbi:MAG: hypothetical protein IV090_09215 [Candidatus Sericytochromatia bacterium]|nr:hypothetical protein [Candidatus Sericytochromatia bacterium]
MSELFSELAREWLQQKLWPLALQAADLPPETTPAAILALGLPQPNSDKEGHYDTLDARTYCSQCPLFCASLFLADGASSDEAMAIAQAILGLIWRDAIERAIARDLDFATNGFDLPDAEFAARFDKADAQWERWLASTEAVKTALQDLMEEYADRQLWTDVRWA